MTSGGDEELTRGTDPPPVPWKSPVALRVGAVGFGVGVGCGAGIGFGKPLNLYAIPGVGQVVSGIGDGLSSLSSMVGLSGGVPVRKALQRLGVKGLDAGFGCGVGIGYGFGAGLMVKPSFLEDTSRKLREFAERTMSNLGVKRRAANGPSTVGLRGSEGLMGVDSVQKFNAVNTTALTGDPRGHDRGSLQSTPVGNSHPTLPDLQKQHSQMMLTLLRQQDEISELRRDNEALKASLCKLDGTAPFCGKGGENGGSG